MRVKEASRIHRCDKLPEIEFEALKDLTSIGRSGSTLDEFKIVLEYFLKTDDAVTFHQDNFRVIIFRD